MSDISQLDRLVAEEPFVRTLAQSLLAGEADEVVQQTYMRALRHSGEDIEQPRSWLATVVRNVASNLQRDEKRRLQRERDAKASSLAPSSDELMDREEQRQRLVAAIDSLPAQLRSVLLLRFYEGLAPRHIAQKTGLSNDIVRNRIRRALQLLRERLDQEHNGDRRAWMLALVPIACPTAAQTARATVATSTATVVTFALLATAAMLAWVMWPDVPPPSETNIVEATTPVAAVAATPAVSPVRNTANEPRIALPVEDVVTSNSLEVHVLHSGEPNEEPDTPAAGTVLFVHRTDTDQRAPLVSKRCDEHGVVRFDDLPPGKLWISNDRGTDALPTTLGAGQHKVVQYLLDPGITLTGTVVDEEGNPVPFARIEGSPRKDARSDAKQFGTADAQGHFHIRDVAMRAVVGARASGHMAGIMLSVQGQPGTTVEVPLTVGPPACDVTGVVRDETGKPIPFASIGIGGGRTSGLQGLGGVRPPLPSLTQSDENGRFEAWGVPTGKLIVFAVARGRAPWGGTCITHPEARNELQISMLPCATIEGTVLTEDGKPAAGATIEVNTRDRFDFQFVRSDDNGFFRIGRLTPGWVRLRAHAPMEGGAHAKVEAQTGVATTCSLTLSHRPMDDRMPGERPRHRPVHQPNSRIGEPVRQLGPPRKEQPRSEDAADEGDEQRNRRRGNSPRVPGRQGPGRRGTGAQPNRPRQKRRPRGTAQVSGTIVGPDGSPIENALVLARKRNKGPMIEGMTGPRGEFSLEHMPSGRWHVRILANAMPQIELQAFELGSGEQRNLAPTTVPAGGRLRILLPLDYKPQSKIKLTGATQLPHTPVHHVNGARETDFLPAGEYEMTVSVNDIELMREKVTVVAGKLSVVSFR